MILDVVAFVALVALYFAYDAYVNRAETAPRYEATSPIAAHTRTTRRAGSRDRKGARASRLSVVAGSPRHEAHAP
jgi:hypothetical protein